MMEHWGLQSEADRSGFAGSAGVGSVVPQEALKYHAGGAEGGAIAANWLASG